MNHDYLNGAGEILSRKTRRRLRLDQLGRANVVNSVVYGGSLSSDTTASPSGFWGDCPQRELESDPERGFFKFDNFIDFPLPGTQTTEISLPGSPYKVFSSSAGVWQADSMPHSAALVTPVASQGGVISGLCDTAGDQCVIGTQQCPILLTTTQTSRVWFEARVAKTSILTNMGQLFVGLCENVAGTYGAALPLADANATDATVAMIGFNRLEDGLSVINTSYADHAAVWTDIQASASSGTLAANTWIKLGMKVDMRDRNKCVRFYVNGVECSTGMTKTALLALTHVDVKPLGPCVAFFADSAGTADYTYIDWWQYAQTFGA